MKTRLAAGNVLQNDVRQDGDYRLDKNSTRCQMVPEGSHNYSIYTKGPFERGSLTDLIQDRLGCVNQVSQVSDIGDYPGDPDVNKMTRGSGGERNWRSMTGEFMYQVDGNQTEDKSYTCSGARPKVSNIIQSVKGLSYTDQEIDIAVRRLRESQTAVSLDSLIDVCYDVRREQDLSGVTSSYGYVENTEPADVNSTQTEEEQSDQELPVDKEERFRQAVKNALRQKKADLMLAIDCLTYTCCICGDNEANILLLPCAHLVSCEDCLAGIRRCPLERCNKVVRGTKEVFFA